MWSGPAWPCFAGACRGEGLAPRLREASLCWAGLGLIVFQGRVLPHSPVVFRKSPGALRTREVELCFLLLDVTFFQAAFQISFSRTGSHSCSAALHISSPFLLLHLPYLHPLTNQGAGGHFETSEMKEDNFQHLSRLPGIQLCPGTSPILYHLNLIMTPKRSGLFLSLTFQVGKQAQKW